MAIRELPPDGPPPLRNRTVSPLWLGLVVVVALLAGAVGWMLRDLAVDDSADPTAMAVGHISDFPVGSLSAVDLDVEYYDPYGVEGTSDLADDGAPGPKPATLLVLRQDGGQVVAMHASGRWLGCRVQPVDRDSALAMFSSGVPEWFSAGLVDPCHGVLYAATGEQILGPGDRGLDRFPVQYAADGTVLVDLTRPVRTGSLPPGGAPIDVMSGGAAVS